MQELKTLKKDHNRIFIPDGQAIIGMDEPGEQPEINIYIPGFFIDKYAVCNQSFAVFIEKNGYKNRQYWSDEGFEWKTSNKIESPAFWDDNRYNQPNQPVTGISFYEAQAYAAFVHGRLPTEVEWEKAARGTQGAVFPWGNETPDERFANYAPDFIPIYRAATKVDAYPEKESPFGCNQMAGNVFEWCSDYFHFDTPQHRHDRFYVEERISDRRVLKGGAWTTGISRLRPSARWSYTPNLRDNILGFRVAYDHIEDNSRIQMK